VGESQFGRGDIHCGTVFIYVLGTTDSPLRFSNHKLFSINRLQEIKKIQPLTGARDPGEVYSSENELSLSGSV
jgi:hypothetical protein